MTFAKHHSKNNEIIPEGWENDTSSRFFVWCRLYIQIISANFFNTIYMLVYDNCFHLASSHKWKYAAYSYNSAIEILWNTDDYTDEQVKQFQLFVDQSYLTFQSMYGEDFATNYWYMLSSSHCQHYMKVWKYMYCYSIQGWEALTRFVRIYLAWWTNKGGQDNMKSKLWPIANLFLWHFFWIFDWSKEFENGRNYVNEP